MNEKPYQEGIVLICDWEGRVEEILHDGLGVTGRIQIGHSVTRLVEMHSVTKMLNLLQGLKQNDALYDWELNVPLRAEVTTLNFAGINHDDQIWIVAARTREQVVKLYEELMQIQNEQMTMLRATVKENSELTQKQSDQETLFNEISKLNNELINLQRELAKKNVQLERLNVQKNQFLGMAAHDLRTPLGVIQSYSEFLLEETAEELDEEHLEFVNVIRGSSQFMLSLVNDLLDISAIESGKMALNLQATDLEAVLRHNITLNQVLAGSKNMKLHLDITAGLPRLILDANKIEQVLNNLIGNAVKFSNPGTKISVRAEMVEGEVQVSVRDEGQGIPESELNNLFRPFSRTSVQSTAGEKNTGLGLLITKRIIKGHNGRIWIESEVGKGTTFFFTLPLVEEKPPTATESTITSSDSMAEWQAVVQERPLRILVAEDNQVIRKITLRTLAQLGHTADTAGTGVEVLEAMTNQVYDLILMDIHMPVMDGLDATREIRRRFPPERQPYIVAMSASSYKDIGDECETAGMNDEVSKPIVAKELLSVLSICPILSAKAE